jgi:hypothetical protein
MAADAAESRPKAVIIVAIFLFLATSIAIFVGGSLLFPNRIMDRLWELNQSAAALFRAMGRISGVPLLLLGVGTFAAAIGLLRRQRWAWWFAVIVFAVSGIGDLVGFTVTGDWLRTASGVVISSAFVWSLIRKRVRIWCCTNSDFSME